MIIYYGVQVIMITLVDHKALDISRVKVNR